MYMCVQAPGLCVCVLCVCSVSVQGYMRPGDEHAHTRVCMSRTVCVCAL